DIGIHIEVEETGTTFAENAILKARAIYEQTKIPTIADDSGLEVDALGNAPGVYSARYSGENATDDQNIRKLLDVLWDVRKDQRTARFVSVIHMILDDQEQVNVCGECQGMIGYVPTGENGFGYDSVFMVGERSFAELSDDEKDRISHRGRALEKLVEILKEKSERIVNK
ncbi:MAG: XTP/dITP diphosphatase, partial [Oscillospiraceae bacterium]|nr:XTP/dITP diphosphatase [Oscillospiraceae bacterium]